MKFDYTLLEGYAGGELAHRLPKEIRIDMAARGYSPMSYEDVAAYCTGKKPIHSLFESAGINDKRFSKMGSSNSNDSKDWGTIFKEIEGGEPIDDYDTHAAGPVNPRQQVQEQMSSYGKNGSQAGKPNMDQRIQELIGNKQPATNAKAAPANKQTLVVDKKEAAKLGYSAMVQILKANKSLLENTNTTTSQAMTKAAAGLTTGRASVHPSVQKDYDYGVEYAKKNYKG